MKKLLWMILGISIESGMCSVNAWWFNRGVERRVEREGAIRHADPYAQIEYHTDMMRKNTPYHMGGFAFIFGIRWMNYSYLPSLDEFYYYSDTRKYVDIADSFFTTIFGISTVYMLYHASKILHNVRQVGGIMEYFREFIPPFF